jgi:thiol-disulfide isomerase/thioredoxin
MPKSSIQRRQALATLGAIWVSGAHSAASDSGSPGYDVQPWPRGKAAPAVPAMDMAGQAVSLQALHGKVVLINFWASWCEPCRAEMPSLQALAEREKAQLVVLTINLKESPEAIARFVQSTGLTLPVLRDHQGDTARAWGIKIYPSTVLVDSAGQVRSVARGALDWAGSEGEALWRPLLKAETQRTPKR